MQMNSLPQNPEVIVIINYGSVPAAQKREFMMSNPAFADLDAVKVVDAVKRGHGVPQRATGGRLQRRARHGRGRRVVRRVEEVRRGERLVTPQTVADVRLGDGGGGQVQGGGPETGPGPLTGPSSLCAIHSLARSHSGSSETRVLG